MKYSDEIKDEKKGAKHYRFISRRDSKNRRIFKSMARDEQRHERLLKKMK